MKVPPLRLIPDHLIRTAQSSPASVWQPGTPPSQEVPCGEACPGSRVAEMVEWRDPEVVKKCSLALQKVTLFTTGIFGFEYLLSLSFEWSVLRKRTTLQWRFISYFLCRYLMLFSLCFIVIIQHTSSPTTCRVLAPIAVTGMWMASVFASTNLATRTLIIWSHERTIVYSIVLISTVQLLYFACVGSTQVRGRWDPVDKSCTVLFLADELSAFTSLFSACYDFLILILTIIGVSRIQRSARWKVLYNQGLIYFVCTCVVNIPAMVLFLLELNPPMSAMFAIPAYAIGTMLSCRAVTSFMKTRDKCSSTTYARRNHGERQGRTASGQVFSTNVTFPSAVYCISSIAQDNTQLRYELAPRGALNSGVKGFVDRSGRC